MKHLTIILAIVIASLTSTATATDIKFITGSDIKSSYVAPSGSRPFFLPKPIYSNILYYTIYLTYIFYFKEPIYSHILYHNIYIA